MTVFEFMMKCPMGAEFVSIWSNEACRGYCVEAMENAGLDQATIEKVNRGLSQAFDELSVEDAERKWVRW